MPDLIIPSESSFSSEQPSPSGDGAAMPADIQRVLSPEHASAAVMSSRVMAHLAATSLGQHPPPPLLLGGSQVQAWLVVRCKTEQACKQFMQGLYKLLQAMPKA